MANAVFEIQETADKGRCVVATTPLETGSLVLTDTLFVSATWDEDHCIECEEDHDFSTCQKVNSLYPSAIVKKLPEILDVLEQLSEETKMEILDGLDRQRVFVKCLCMVHHYNADIKKRKKRNPKKKIEVSGEIPLPLIPLFNLRPSNKSECLEFVKTMRKNKLLNACSLLPHNLSDDNVANLIGILNANSHEIEQGGSGIFLLGSMMNHSCRPNCNFVCDGNNKQLSVYTTTSVQPNEHLTIDYNDECYLPTAKRQAALQKTYGFVCTCVGCVEEPEYCRAFVCPSCQNILLPSPKGSWKCTSCAKEPSPEAKAQMLAAERVAEDDPPTSLEELQALVRKHVLHEQHYVIFFIMQEFAREFAGSSDVSECKIARDLLVKLNLCLERVLPRYHHAKEISLDMLAQVKLKLGDIPGASADFNKAYEIARTINGANNSSTLQLKALAEKTPKTVQELQAFYRKTQ